MKIETADDFAAAPSPVKHLPQQPGRGPVLRSTIAMGVTAAAALSALVLRWYHLGGESLWVDEIQTNFAASLSPSKVIGFAQSSDAPPLYFLIEHYWVALFGNSEFALRALSALFGTLAIPVFYLLARKVLRDLNAVALAMWLFAFSMMQVWYSREARTYELVSFVALAGLYALVLFLEQRSALSFAAIVVALVASLYLHNIMPFYAFAANVFWLVYPSKRPWTQRLREAVLADVLVGVLYLPWVPTLFAQANVDVVQKYFWALRPTLATLVRTLTFLAGFNVAYLSSVPGRVLPLSSDALWILTGAAVGLLCLALLAGGLWRVPKADRNANVALILYALIPVLAIFELSRMTTPLFIDRIFVNSALVVPIVFAYPLALRKERQGRLLYLFLGIVVAAATSLSAIGYLRYQRKDDWRDAIRSVLSVPESNRLVVFIPRMGELLFDYYAQRFPAAARHISKIALPISYLEGFPPPRGGQVHEDQLDRFKRTVESGKYSEIDLLFWYERHDDPNESVLDYVSHHYSRREEQRFTEIRLLRYVAPSP